MLSLLKSASTIVGLFFILLTASGGVQAKLSVVQNATFIEVRNDRLRVGLIRSSGLITNMYLDGINLLGTGTTYLDCYCIPSGFYTVGSSGHTTSNVVTGKDTENRDYAGLIVSDIYKPTGQVFQQFWFLRDGETGLHAFSRLAYHNQTTPFLRNLQELRTLFRPNTPLWTHLSSDSHTWGPLPSAQGVSKEKVAQDATWWLGNTPNDPYFSQFAPYFTKYTFSNPWRNQKAHGLLSNGSFTNGTWVGAWLIMNTKDTYYGGPLHSDLLVDGIVYNYISSNHHGNGVPNITDGFDRTFGPQFYYFNTGSGHDTLRTDAENLAVPTWSSVFYNSIAKHVEGYVPPSQRVEVELDVTSLPANAESPIAVLSANGMDFQDNAADANAHQRQSVSTKIPQVRPGTYRLTIYADGVFGQYIRDGVVVSANKVNTVSVRWEEESAGKELWRLGTPDKSSGEFKRGNALDIIHPRQPNQYRIYWGHYNFTEDFPKGVNFTIGKSSVAEDFNYIHWSVYGPTFIDPTVHVLNPNWTVNFDIANDQMLSDSTATFTLQLAAVKTASGNTDVPNGGYSNLTLSYIFNDHEPLEWNVQWYQSSSCGVRSAVSCYNIATKFTFPGKWLKTGHNVLVLQVPYNATDIETAVLPASVYVQYDALRLEISSSKDSV